MTGISNISKYLFIFFSVLFLYSTAQPAGRRLTRTEYIELYKDEAIKEMLRTGIPASITLAQGILESGDGNSPLAVYANNHFGIKCHNDWEGETFIMDDDAKNECFRKYEHALQSYHDHSEFLVNRNRYAFLFELKTTDYKGWAKGLKKAGYATNPKYADILIDLIETYKLYQYDKYVKVPPRKLKKSHNTYKSVHNSKNFELKSRNHIKYIVVKEGDTFYKIAKQFNMGLWQLYKYNDYNKNDVLKAGEVLYLQPKRNKSKEKAEHKVSNGETMHAIAQQYGIKLKKLYKLNKMIPGTQPNEGAILRLR
jgi:LysM repeat protein